MSYPLSSYVNMPSRSLKGLSECYILSAKHGLIPSEKVIEPYDMGLDRGRIVELLPDMVTVLKKYDKVIFFKAGAKAAYDECMKAACDRAGRPLDSFGTGFMGGIGELEGKIEAARG